MRASATGYFGFLAMLRLPMDAPAQTTSPAPPGRLFRFSWFFYLILAVAGLVWLGLQRGAIEPGVFFDTATWWRDLAAGLAVAGALLGVWAAARRWLPAARELEETVAKLLGPIERAEAIGLAFLSGIAEEIFFRGAVQEAWGWVVAAALFAVLHTGPGRAMRSWTAFAALAGLALGAVTLATGNLLAAIVAHFVVNAVGLTRVARLAASTGTGNSGTGT